MANQSLKIIGMKKEEFDALVNDEKDPQVFLQPAHLIPMTKPGNEVTLTSIFLMGLSLIHEFRKLFSAEVKLSKAGQIYAYTEVSFKDFKDPEGKGNLRFDGMILVVSGGTIKDAAIFEMKNKSNEIQPNQIELYSKIANHIGINRLVSISNQFVATPTQYPVKVKTPKDFELYHFSWSYILTLAHILLFDNDININDPDQVRIMEEIVWYFEHPTSGICGFTQMKPGWKNCVESINSGAKLKLSDKCVEEAVTSWQQEEKDMALILSRKLGLLVKTGSSKYKDNLQKRINDDKKTLINEKRLVSILKVSRAVSDITISTLFDYRKVEMSVKVIVPQDKTSRGQIGFIRKQIEKSIKKTPETFSKLSNSIVMGINVKRSRGIDRYSLDNLDQAVEDLKGKDINDIQVILVKDFGKQFGSSKKFVEIIEQMLLDYYKGIVQHLSNWEKPAPKIRDNGDQVIKE